MTQEALFSVLLTGCITRDVITLFYKGSFASNSYVVSLQAIANLGKNLSFLHLWLSYFVIRLEILLTVFTQFVSVNFEDCNVTI